MGTSARPGLAIAIAAAVLVFALLGGQALAAASAPPGGVASTGRVLGQTSFAYLGGLRTFAAAILWARLEPLFHGFYGGKNVDQLTEFLPTMWIVQALDPQFEQVYYNASFIVARQGMMDEALVIARRGLENNPSGGLMSANLIQLLLMQDKKANLAEMLKLADEGMQPDTRWTSSDDRYEGYGIFATVYELGGYQRTAQAIRAKMSVLRQQGAGLGVERDSQPASGGK